jgi:hypothetical protein
MQSALLSLHIIDVFQMTGLLRRTFFLNEQETKYVSVYLNGDLKPHVKSGTSSGHVVLNDLQWFILVIFKSNISKNEVYELGDSRHTLSMYCGGYICITSENTQVYLTKRDWSKLMDLASACIDRKVIKFCRLQDELVEWRGVLNQSAYVHLQTQMPLISMHCGMKYHTKTSLVPNKYI